MLFLDKCPHKGSASADHHPRRLVHAPACAEARRIFRCRDCGMETGPEEYRDQIESWMETVCKITFGDSAPGASKAPNT